MSLSQPWIFFVVNETPKLSATTATSTGISQGTADQDADLDLAPMKEVSADTLALDLQEIDVTIEIETKEDDHQSTGEIVGIATTAEMTATTE